MLNELNPSGVAFCTESIVIPTLIHSVDAGLPRLADPEDENVSPASLTSAQSFEQHECSETVPTQVEELAEGPVANRALAKKARARERAKDRAERTLDDTQGKHESHEAQAGSPAANAIRSGWPCPPGFRITREHLDCEHLVKEGDDLISEWVPVCAPIKVLAQVSDEESKCAYLLRYLDIHSHRQERMIPARIVSDPRELEATFSELGIGRGPGIKDLVAFFRGLTFHRRLPVGVMTGKLGWHEASYVLPDGVINPTGFEGEKIFLNTTVDVRSLRTKGTMDGWRHGVALPAAKNSRPAFALCAALAAPMLSRMRNLGGGFNFVGETSQGKSTTVEVAASVWGSPAFALSWEGTQVGIEQYAVARNDSVMILDEQGLANVRNLGAIVYQIVSGQERMRGTKTLTPRPCKTWTTMLLSTSEKSLADKLEEAGDQIQAGHEVRLAHVPICPRGCTQGFEDWTEFESSEGLAKHFHQASAENYGHPAREFIKILVNFKAEDWEKVRTDVADWVNCNTPAGALPQVRRVADRFALVAIAGEIAIRGGVLPWVTGTASWAAVECFQSWIQYRGGAGSSEAAVAARGLLRFLIRHDARFAPVSDMGGQPIRDLAGWYKTEESGKTYFVTPDALREAVPGIPSSRVASALIMEGLIEGTDRKNDRHAGQCQVTVAGAGRPWTYKVTAAAREAFEARERGLPPPATIPEKSMNDMD